MLQPHSTDFWAMGMEHFLASPAQVSKKGKLPGLVIEQPWQCPHQALDALQLSRSREVFSVSSLLQLTGNI